MSGTVTDISYKNIINIALPIILGLVAQNIINVVDTVFLAHLGELALGVGAIGGLYYFVFIIFGFGFGTGIQIMIGRRNGEEKFNTIGTIVTHSLFVMGGMALLLFAMLFFFSDNLLGLIISDDTLRDETNGFMVYRRWGVLFAYTNIVFRAFFVGVLKTRILIYSTLLMTLINIVFDYGLIFGALGMPEMGIAGAALASVLAEISATLFLVLWYVFVKGHRKYHVKGVNTMQLKLLKALFKVSGPVMLQNFISFGAWFTFFLVIEKIGTRELAISNIVRSIYMVLMIPVWGLSSATHSMVSNLMGARAFGSIVTLIKRISFLSITCTLTVIAGFIFIPEKIIGIYTKDAELMHETIAVFNVVTAALVFFSVSFIIFSAISGTGKTTLALIIETLSILLYIVAVYYTGLVLKLPIEWIWATEILYFFLLGVLSALYFLFYKWKEVKI